MLVSSIEQVLTIAIPSALFLVFILAVQKKLPISSEIKLGQLSWALRINNEEKKSLPEKDNEES
jgi:hypothetical protein